MSVWQLFTGVWQLFAGVQRPLRFKAPYCKRLQGAADDSAQTYVLYFRCPTTMQVRCPVNAYGW